MDPTNLKNGKFVQLYHILKSRGLKEYHSGCDHWSLVAKERPSLLHCCCCCILLFSPHEHLGENKMAGSGAYFTLATSTRKLLNCRAIIYAAAALSISPFSVCSKNSCSSDKGCHDEVKSAILADKARKENGGNFDTVFAKILRKEIKADIVYEDEKVKYW